MGPLSKLKQRLSHFVPISQNQGRITGNDFSAKAVLVTLHSGFDRLAAKCETTAVGLANPPIVRRKLNSFFVRGIRILEGASCSKRRRDSALWLNRSKSQRRGTTYPDRMLQMRARGFAIQGNRVKEAAPILA